MKKGVYLIGAGPGDVKLITVKAKEILNLDFVSSEFSVDFKKRRITSIWFFKRVRMLIV